MKIYRVRTTSSLRDVPARKSVFEGPLLEARATASYRAIKYEGSSMIFSMQSDPEFLLIETHLRDGSVVKP